jgi:ABC-type Fe3+ transport system permease subunit
MILTNLINHPIFAASCETGSNTSKFLLFPRWYEYLPSGLDSNNICSPQLTGINDVWLIIAAVIEILLRLAAIMAVGFIIYGGVQLILSQGDPQQTNNGRNTVTSAVVGLFICIFASIVIAFIAERL